MKEYEANKYRYRNPEEVLSYLKNKKLLFEPGKHFAYSNIGYLMLGLIIEKVTGKSYEEAVNQYIIDKINLKETDVMTAQTLKSLIVRGHHHGKVLAETKNYTIPFASGSIISSPRDLVHFLQAIMNGSMTIRVNVITTFLIQGLVIQRRERNLSPCYTRMPGAPMPQPLQYLLPVAKTGYASLRTWGYAMSC